MTSRKQCINESHTIQSSFTSLHEFNDISLNKKKNSCDTPTSKANWILWRTRVIYLPLLLVLQHLSFQLCVLIRSINWTIVKIDGDYWKREMHHSMETFENESTNSLREIKQCFVASGRPFDENFRQYFWRCRIWGEKIYRNETVEHLTFIFVMHYWTQVLIQSHLSKVMKKGRMK